MLIEDEKAYIVESNVKEFRRKVGESDRKEKRREGRVEREGAHTRDADSF